MNQVMPKMKKMLNPFNVFKLKKKTTKPPTLGFDLMIELMKEVMKHSDLCVFSLDGVKNVLAFILSGEEPFLAYKYIYTKINVVLMHYHGFRYSLSHIHNSIYIVFPQKLIWDLSLIMTFQYAKEMVFFLHKRNVKYRFEPFIPYLATNTRLNSLIFSCKTENPQHFELIPVILQNVGVKKLKTFSYEFYDRTPLNDFNITVDVLRMKVHDEDDLKEFLISNPITCTNTLEIILGSNCDPTCSVGYNIEIAKSLESIKAIIFLNVFKLADSFDLYINKLANEIIIASLNYYMLFKNMKYIEYNISKKLKIRSLINIIDLEERFKILFESYPSGIGLTLNFNCVLFTNKRVHNNETLKQYPGCEYVKKPGLRCLIRKTNIKPEVLLVFIINHQCQLKEPVV